MGYSTKENFSVRKITKKDGKQYTIRNSRNRIFHPNEWNKFMSCLKESKKEIFYCLINTGARINEVLGIKKEDIDFDNKTITLRQIKKRTRYSNGMVRVIPISTQYCIRLKKYCNDLKNENKIFKVTKQGVHQLFKRNLKKAGLNELEFSTHNIRKTTECWLNFLGNNHLLLLLHFGHNQSTALQHYLNINTFDSNYKYKARIILGDLYI